MSDFVLLLAYQLMENHPNMSLFEALDYVTNHSFNESYELLEKGGKVNERT